MRSWGLGKRRKEGRLDTSVDNPVVGKARDSKAQDRLVALVLLYLPLGQLLRESDRDGDTPIFPVVGRSRQAAGSPASSPHPGISVKHKGYYRS